MFVRALVPMFLSLVPFTLLIAQEQPRGKLFAGYSYVDADLGSGSKSALHGYELSSDFDPLQWLGITFDSGGYFGSAPVPSCFGGSANTCVISGPTTFSHLYTVDGGVRFSRRMGRAKPFARAAFGVAVLEACPFRGCESKGSFAQSYGGGVDLRLSERRLGWRLQGDLFQTRFFHTTQNDFRLSTGLLIFFYKH